MRLKQYEEENNYILQDTEASLDESYVKPLNTIERVKYLFTAPSRTMKDLAERPRILFPLLVIIFGVAITELILLNVTNTNQDIIQIEETLLRNLTLGALILMPVAFRLFIWLGKVMFTHGVAGVLGGDGSFKGVASVIGYATFINVIGDFIRAIIVLVTGNSLVSISLIALFPGIKESTPLHVIMQQLNIFTIIYLGLATIGVMYVHKISKVKSIIAVFGTWIAFVIFIILALSA